MINMHKQNDIDEIAETEMEIISLRRKLSCMIRIFKTKYPKSRIFARRR